MRCRVCRGETVIELRQHNAAFCSDHFVKFCRDQVQRTIDKYEMFPAAARLLVAVSGGKDSLALWDILEHLGYSTEGLVIGLGIGTYSDDSTAAARNFADERGFTLHVHDLQVEHGFDIPAAAAATRRVPCSACGLSKRHVLDAAAVSGGFDALVTGHNLDDEAAVLLGNVVRWQTDYLARQAPVLEAHSGFPRKAKPLVRLGEREMAAYCIVRGIDYVIDECPMAEGNRHLHYKELLNGLESGSPGAKQAFYTGFQDRIAEVFAAEWADDHALGTCSGCGAPTSADVCSFCRLSARAQIDRDPTGADGVTA